MMERSAIEKIEEMSAMEIHISDDGIERCTKSLHSITPPKPAIMAVHSLSAVIVYFNENAQIDVNDKQIIHVVDYDQVRIVSPLDGIYRGRENYLQADLDIRGFNFDRWYNVEDFVVALQALFIQDDTTANIMKVVGNITLESEQKTMDDGVSQSVTAKVGIAKVENVGVPNPVILRPYRTFAEVEQPASKFVFRMRKGSDGDGPQCALFEADGGLWKRDAIQNIAKSLAEALPQDTIILA